MDKNTIDNKFVSVHTQCWGFTSRLYILINNNDNITDNNNNKYFVSRGHSFDNVKSIPDEGRRQTNWTRTTSKSTTDTTYAITTNQYVYLFITETSRLVKTIRLNITSDHPFWRINSTLINRRWVVNVRVCKEETSTQWGFVEVKTK